jgi:hypothetical protein
MLERVLMNPSLKTILSVATALGVTAGEIVGRVEGVLSKGWRRDNPPEKTSGQIHRISR